MDKKIIAFLRHIPAIKRSGGIIVLVSAVLSLVFLTAAFAGEGPMDSIPAKGIVTMVDLGAKSCIPCKMMAPILEKLEKKYDGKAVIHFYDVRENSEPAERFKIRAIPTQLFFDKEGKEVYRHLGFMSEADIIRQLDKMGVK